MAQSMEDASYRLVKSSSTRRRSWPNCNLEASPRNANLSGEDEARGQGEAGHRHHWSVARLVTSDFTNGQHSSNMLCGLTGTSQGPQAHIDE
jgi:hypothetical protein